jgi:adenylate kinase family enzyme
MSIARLPAHIHITGASGSGTTTLGQTIAQKQGHGHLDTDDFFWEPTDPPYTAIRPSAERLRLLHAALDSMGPGGEGAQGSQGRWVLSGSLDGWGDPLILTLDLVVWLTVPQDVRVKRLLSRERAEFGVRLDAGGDMEKNHEDFIEWAKQYDSAGMEQRSFVRQTEWTARLPCPCIRVDGDQSAESTLATVEEFWAGRGVS